MTARADASGGPRPRGRKHSWIAALAASALLVACSGGNEHRNRADDLLEEGRYNEAVLELQTALKAEPDNAELSLMLADLLHIGGDLKQGRFFYAEAYRIDPTLTKAGVHAAWLLSGDERQSARRLIEGILEENPDSGWGHVGKAELDLHEGNYALALEGAERGVELEPELPDAHWMLARVLLAQITDSMRQRAIPSNTPYERAMAALDTFERLKPERQWRADLQRARLFSLWVGHKNDALAHHAKAFDTAKELGIAHVQLQIAQSAEEHGHRIQDAEILEWALLAQIELAPNDPVLWDRLATARVGLGRPYADTYEEWVARDPKAPAAHASYAIFLYERKSPESADAYLAEQIEAGEVPAAQLHATRARLLYRNGNLPLALESVDALRSGFPDEHITSIMVAWSFVAQNRPRPAIAMLSELPWVHDDLTAQRLLVDAHSRVGRTPGLLDAMERVIALSPDGTDKRRLQAQVYEGRGFSRSSLKAYTQLRNRGIKLNTGEMMSYARAAYDAGNPRIGMKLLHELIDRPRPPLGAVLELRRRSAGDPKEQAYTLAALERVLKQRFSRTALRETTRADVEGGNTGRAIERVDEAIARAKQEEKSYADLLVMRSELQLVKGDRDAAREDAWAAVRTDPNRPDTLAALSALYATPEEARAELKRLDVEKPDRDFAPEVHAFRSRLFQTSGSIPMARWSLERALVGGLKVPALKNDLAFLLAQQRVDLDRARVFAEQGVQELGDVPEAHHTLGFVRLAQGDSSLALQSLRRALAISQRFGTTKPEYHYHLALALEQEGEVEQAHAQLEQALAMDEDFPDKRKAVNKRDALAKRLEL